MSEAVDENHEDLPEQMRIRREKLDRLRESGVDPYPVGYPRTTSIGPVRESHEGLEPDVATGDRVSVTGRVLLYRTGGKLCFATIRDDSGSIQIMLALDKIGAEALDSWKADVDLGDHVGITGEVITSKRGELSIMADSWALTSKCLRPLPEKHKGLTDPEARVRQRYVDLIVNPEARQLAHQRGKAVQALRSVLLGRDYLEVETPMLQQVHGGATARPFTTHINAYDLDLYLRIAPELYLKRLVVGGVEKVFEINRNFRNEGADSTHNPEFTMLEFYEAYGDYDTAAELTTELFRQAAKAVFGDMVVRHPEHGDIDLGAEWPSITLYGSVGEALGEEITTATPVERLRELADAREITWDPAWGPGKLVEHLFEELVEHTLIRPTYVRDFPLETSPLTRQHRQDPLLTEKWDLIGFGMELGTGFSELVDPVEQRRRLTEQSLLAAGGDAEAMQLDEDFLRALEYGMPPTGGVGVGIDRMLMAFTGKGIRETILFPMVKPG
ncbi:MULTISPECIES: bifunctional lysylphosphatidylglycerol synthetase/lysine--tRNA ligase LysX [unclassified Saccharopolyspora]|uniref:bifunctional lysylphosphatidylglycerol synthetase/lysine--tRNA ligase LysX n=1 Tax=unclassified Saccharopolyspora TaxID=2646250 RepID=UPI001CD2B71C|nr:MULTISPECIES: bifunctional lysylphosphatidylglycerol synthetase/lysine--tRNA ligase LysX [unclassified Saccharopolyspora]MCA1229705.1 bifunctional lysylphosphatidylglycerol synthetase/lysine--tRNA ligase LysX [Saccharopolyspora sp. 6M]MCA1283539.1 bifunctional lysylphosphatidylglycerol synthetase/lysine--tRNA ligase LysX [Saccharopolyspora sp. 7B]